MKKIRNLSILALLTLIVISLFAELWLGKRALIVSYQGEFHFPVLIEPIPGSTFGLSYDYETNYHELANLFADQKESWLLMPIIPYGPYESVTSVSEIPPTPPSLRHPLGTDEIGRDVLARVVYGFRIALVFALVLTMVNFAIGIFAGAAMGYLGGWFDLLMQRLIEVWINIPFIYVVMILSSLVVPNFWWLLLIMATFGWTQITWYIRTEVYKEKELEYVAAARAIGCSRLAVLIKHILPNTLHIVVTFLPFSLANAMIAIVSLDYLGFGLPAPTPSWGELLKQGADNLSAPWIILPVLFGMILVLGLANVISEPRAIPRTGN